MNDVERLQLRQFQKEVQANMDGGRTRFPWEVNAPMREVALAVLMEEEGKLTTSGHIALLLSDIAAETGALARTMNKLRIAVDPMVRQQWDMEARHRMVTLVAVTQRMWLAWGQLDSAASESLAAKEGA